MGIELEFNFNLNFLKRFKRIFRFSQKIEFFTDVQRASPPNPSNRELPGVPETDP